MALEGLGGARFNRKLLGVDSKVKNCFRFVFDSVINYQLSMLGPRGFCTSAPMVSESGTMVAAFQY